MVSAADRRPFIVFGPGLAELAGRRRMLHARYWRADVSSRRGLTMALHGFNVSVRSVCLAMSRHRVLPWDLALNLLQSHSTHNRSFRRRVFPANHLAMVLTMTCRWWWWWWCCCHDDNWKLCRWWSTSDQWSCSRRRWPASTCTTAIIRVPVSRVSMAADATPTKISIDAAVHLALSTPTAKIVGRPLAVPRIC